MKPIGGFFELEIPRKGRPYHKKAVALSTGRSCLNVIIKYLAPRKCYLPFYTCDATLEPFFLNNIKFEFYSLGKELDPVSLPSLKEGEYFLYTNYFGVKCKTTASLIEIFKKQLIIDDTHNFFVKGNSSNWSFTSARKYFGVPDGAYLYAPVRIKEQFPRFTGISINHNLNRLLGFQDLSYRQFIDYEKKLNSDIYRISIISERLLNNIDYQSVKKKRMDNFSFLHASLKQYNEFRIDKRDNSVPFCYPFLPSKKINLEELYKRNLFIPSYWSDTINRRIKGFDYEKYISNNLLPLPIDHRYGRKEMELMVEIVTSKL